MHIFLQNLVSIQPRTNPPKIWHNLAKLLLILLIWHPLCRRLVEFVELARCVVVLQRADLLRRVVVLSATGIETISNSGSQAKVRPKLDFH